MAAQLSYIPRTVFTILEPISLSAPLLMMFLAGFLGPVISPNFFISTQLPQPYRLPADPTSVLLAYQLGNAYLLLGLLGLFILNTTSELKVVRAYLWALWLGDIGHVGFTLYAMGWDGTMAVGKWTPVVWGNIGATGFLFFTRCLYLAGAFGEESQIATQKRKSKRK